MTKKKGPDKFAKMTVDEIFASWEKAAKSGLKRGQKFAPAVFGPGSREVEKFKAAIKRRMRTATFTKKASDDSTTVAHDIGRICSILAESTTTGVVSLDMFQQAAKLRDIHPACPRPHIGGGRWCE